jgi:hypothetical protein
MQYDFKKKTYEELNELPKFVNAMNKSLKLGKGKGNTSLSSRTVMEDQYGFTLNSTLIKEISSENYTSYTFLIQRDIPSDDYFENLVVDVDSLNNVRAFIVKYLLNSPIEYLGNHNAYSLNAETEITAIEYNNTEAKVDYTDENGCIVTLMCPYGTYDHPAGDFCINADRGDLFWSDPDCGETSGGGGSLGGDTTSGDGSPSGGGSSSGNDDDVLDSGCRGCGDNGNNAPIITDPVFEEEIYDDDDDDDCPTLSFENQVAINNYLSANNNSPEAVAFVALAEEAICAGEVETFEEFIEQDLNNELELNPFLLLDIDCNQIDDWIALAQHTPSASIKNKITDLHQNNNAILGDWNIQYLEEAGGSVVNMDYFAVNITTFPNNPNTGNIYTPNEFLDFFRKNINIFSGTYSQFEPYCEISNICTQETDLWNSTNPTSSIVKINIPAFPYPTGDIYGNDGVVVCSEYTNNYWNFMTMEAPYDSNHPVSGTRQFGIEAINDGSYNLYMRGVDRFENGVIFDLLELFSDVPLVGPKDPFFGADMLWEHIQIQLNTFLNSQSVGGESTIVTPVTNRVNWEDVKDVLQGRKSKSDLGCD